MDGGGLVWANEINTDTVVRFDPKTEQMRVVQLPSNNVGIRKMVTDAKGGSGTWARTMGGWASWSSSHSSSWGGRIKVRGS